MLQQGALNTTNLASSSTVPQGDAVSVVEALTGRVTRVLHTQVRELVSQVVESADSASFRCRGYGGGLVKPNTENKVIEQEIFVL